MKLKELLMGKNKNQELQQIRQENNAKIRQFNHWLKDKLGYKINEETIQILATKRLMDCYEYHELLPILDYYKQLK